MSGAATLERSASAARAAHAEDGDLRREVATCVATLPRAQRVALAQRLTHGRNYAEIAASLGCSEGEARASVYDALRSLRARLGDRL